ncbi:Vacuolar morphogenesis protein 6 [Malassezia cuniculi]|uniref:Vacuolar morphogenesis protein 6 n=1 Tax=Malassezia cuniculi TaxID=948313 RepID=A0AAF0EU70_9BASI|nr:Vacuolar morphogenesis protein 6 [Malassezia cuniculi]
MPLYVGTYGGMLAEYELRSGRNARTGSLTHVAKRAVSQIAYLRATDQLVLLADGNVTLVERTDPSTKTVLPTRGARCISVASWTEGGSARAPRTAARRGMEHIAAERKLAKADTCDVTLLTIGCRRQLVVFRWINDKFLDTHTLALPHTPHAFGGTDGPSVFIGFLGTYARLAVPPVSASSAPPPTDRLPSDAADRVDTGEWAVYAIPLAPPPERGFGATLLGRGRPEPIVVPADGAVLLSQENQGVFVDYNGRPTGQKQQWQTTPDAVAYSAPYLVSLHGGSFSIRVRETLRLVQEISLGEGVRAKLIVAGGQRVCALSEGAEGVIYALERCAWDEQLDSLVAAGEFDEALALLDTLGDAQLDDRDRRRSQVHACVGVAHFAAGRFEEAVDAFLDLDVNPVCVLALYPASVSGSLSRSPDEWLEAFGVAAPLPGILADTGSPAALNALGRFLSDRRRVLRGQLEAAGLRDVAGANAELDDGAPTLTSETLTPFVSILSLHAAVALARIVDTALFKTFLRTKPALVAPLCRVDNWCNVDEVYMLLKQRGMYYELATLYHGKEMHAKALSLLRDHEMATDAVTYMQGLGPKWIKLILEHAHWVLRHDAALGLQIFTADTGLVHELPRQEIAADLEAFDEDICRAYLEHVQDIDESLHTRLGKLYLAQLARGSGDLDRTLAFLQSGACDAQELLKQAPSDQLAVRATLMGRLGRHDDALRIYVHDLKDPDAAARYCERYVSTCTHIFESLLRLHLDCGDMHAAQSLLVHQAEHINAAAALELMPRDWRVKDVADFFVRSGRQRAAHIHAAWAQADLLKAHDAQLEDTLRVLRGRRVVIGEGRTCPRCERRLGNAVVAVIPATGETLHYFCAHKR